MMSRRVLVDRTLLTLSVLAVVVAIVPLLSIVYDVTARGLSAMNWDFFTQLPPTPLPGATGGLGNALIGTLLLVGLATALGLPFGLFSGIYISEYQSRFYAPTVRFLGDVLVGNPSIVIGIMGYQLLVLPFQSFSALAGAFALGSMMIPIISNTTAEALKLVPSSLREASLSLGARKWKTTMLVVANAKGSIATGALLSVARVMGETAPLILTAGISTLWFDTSACALPSVSFGGSFPFIAFGPANPFGCLTSQPVASLTYYIYYFGTSYWPNWVSLAWGAALVLMIIVMGINIVVRLLTRSPKVYA